MSSLIVFVSLSVLVLSVRGQYTPASPCPDLFGYEIGDQQVYGLITMPQRDFGGSITIRANFTVKAQLSSGYLGRLQIMDASGGTLQNLDSGQKIFYRVHFPITSPVPRLTAITVNGQGLCYGSPDSPGPGETVTSISLDHTFYSKRFTAPFSGNSISNNGFSGNTDTFITNFVQDKVYNTGGNDYTYYYTNYSQPDRVTQTQFTRLPPQRNPGRYPSPQRYPVQEQPPSNFQSWNPPQQPPRFQSQEPQRQPPREPQPQRQPPQEPQPQIQPTRNPQPQPQPQRPPPRVPQPQPQPQPTISSDGSCGVGGVGRDRITPLVIGGSDVASGDWPWLVAMYRTNYADSKFVCSGTLVSELHVISAAHCVYQHKVVNTETILLKLGAYNLSNFYDKAIEARAIASVSVHNKYNSKLLSNDITLLTMDEPVSFTYRIRPVCLWAGNADQREVYGRKGAVIGWGVTESGIGGRNTPKLVWLPIVSTTVCRASRLDYHKLTSDTTLCAGARDGTGPCNGDSGSGMYVWQRDRWYLRGIVSASLTNPGDNSCNVGEYFVFTDAAQYMPWISERMT